MPGPRNQKKKKQIKTKQSKPKQHEELTLTTTSEVRPHPEPPSSIRSAPLNVDTPANLSHPLSEPAALVPHDQRSNTSSEHPDLYPASLQHFAEANEESPIPPSLLKRPFIYDPGDGLRVKDARAFLASSFASAPSLNDPMCAEFAEEAVLQMLCTVLPEETALILWHNKSRRTARICPACQRLYRLGDILVDHFANENTQETKDGHTSPYLSKEQELSGLCSPVCFILASYNYPRAIRSTWGRVAEELDDVTWDLLDGPGQLANDMGLGMLLKMTRCHDLGLGQLFFPELDMDSDSTCHEPESEREEDEMGRKHLRVDEQFPPHRGGIVEKMERMQLNVLGGVMAAAVPG